MKAVRLIILFLFSAVINAQYIISDYIDLDNPVNSYTYEHWTTDNGLPQNSINSIMQTADGYIWLATFNGLVRFDGVNFKIYTQENTEFLKSNRIVSLFADSKDRRWIATESNGLFLMEKDSVINFREKYNIPYDFGYYISEGFDGEIFISSHESLVRFKDNKTEFFDLADLTKIEFALSIYADREEKIIYFCFSNKTITYQNGKFNVSELLTTNGTNVITKSSRGFTWVGGGKGLHIKKGDQLLPVPEVNSVITRGIRTLFEDKNGTLWIGTVREGLFFYRHGKLYKFDGLSDDIFNVASIYQDTEENIWVGTNTNGLLKFREKSIFTIDSHNGLESNIVCPITQFNDGSIAVGTPCTGLTIFKDGKITQLDEKNGIYNPCIWSIYQSPDNQIYVGSYGGGLYQFDQTLDKFLKVPEVSETAVFSIYESRNKELWVGGLLGLYVKENNNFYHYDTSDGLAGLDIKSIYEARDGKIWLAINGGVTVWDGHSFTSYKEEDGLSNNYVRTIFEDDFGRLWFGTYGGGISIFDGKNFTNVTTENGLYDNIVSAIQEDDFGRIWMTSNTGLSSANKQDIYDFIDGKVKRISNVSYLKSDGLNSTEFNGGFSPSSLQAADGSLWFPSISGVTVVLPKRLSGLNTAVNLNIEELLVDSLVYTFPLTEEQRKKGIIIPPDFGRIEIKYSSLSFKSPQNIKFKTKLEGIDKAWSKEVKDRSIYYNYLPSGNYTFRLTGTNSDGIWSESEKQIKFVVKARFYETTPFYMLLFVIIITLISAFYIYRMFALGNNAKKLQKMVDQKTSDLQAENTKMEKLLAEVELAKQQIESQKEMLEELNAAKDTFFSIISHDLKNPFNALLGYTELLLSSYDEFTEDEIKTFVTEIRQTSQYTFNLLENLLQWASSQSGNIHLTFKNNDIYEMIKENILLLSTISRKKDIKIEFKGSRIFAKCDEPTISTVIRNLITNAIKFTPREGNILVSLTSTDERVFVSIKDSGIGIEKEKVDKLFRLDNRKTTPGTESEKGTGLGLIICKEFIDKNHGSISVSSIIGQGTEFIIKLPKT